MVQRHMLRCNVYSLCTHQDYKGAENNLISKQHKSHAAISHQRCNNLCMPFLTDSEIISAAASESILENIRVCHTNQKRERKKE